MAEGSFQRGAKPAAVVARRNCSQHLAEQVGTWVCTLVLSLPLFPLWRDGDR